jgi:hypothetical protein
MAMEQKCSRFDNNDNDDIVVLIVVVVAVNFPDGRKVSTAISRGKGESDSLGKSGTGVVHGCLEEGERLWKMVGSPGPRAQLPTKAGMIHTYHIIVL